MLLFTDMAVMKLPKPSNTAKASNTKGKGPTNTEKLKLMITAIYTIKPIAQIILNHLKYPSSFPGRFSQRMIFFDSRFIHESFLTTSFISSSSISFSLRLV